MKILGGELFHPRKLEEKMNLEKKIDYTPENQRLEGPQNDGPWKR